MKFQFHKCIFLLASFTSAVAAGQSNIYERHLNKAISLLKQNNSLGAIVEADSAIALIHTEVKPYVVRGDANRAVKRYKEAIVDYTKALGLDDTNVASLKGRGYAYRHIKSCDSAIKDFDKVLKIDSNDFAVYFGRGSCFAMLGQHKLAIWNLSKSISLESTPNTFYVRALSYYETGQYNLALQDLDGYIRTAKTISFDAKYFRSLTLIMMDSVLSRTQLTTVLTDVRKYLTDKRATRLEFAYNALGIVYSLMGDKEEARSCFQKSLKLSEKGETYFRWGSAEFNFGNYVEAARLLSKSTKLLPYPSARVFYNLGYSQIMANDTLGCISSLEKAVQLDSSNREIYQLRVVSLFKDIRYTEVVLKDIERLLLLTNSISEKAHGLSLIAVIQLRSNRLEQARSAADSAVYLCPTEPLHYLVRAMIVMKINLNDGQVLTDLNEAIKLNPAFDKGYLLKANYLAQTGNHKEGCKILDSQKRKGKEIPKEVYDFICSAKLPLNGKVPEISILIEPYGRPTAN